MTNGLGIAGSLADGRLEFARGDAGMVKRLHLGRASEAGVCWPQAWQPTVSRGRVPCSKGATVLYERLQRLEDEADLSWLGALP